MLAGLRPASRVAAVLSSGGRATGPPRVRYRWAVRHPVGCGRAFWLGNCFSGSLACGLASLGAGVDGAVRFPVTLAGRMGELRCGSGGSWGCRDAVFYLVAG